MMTSEAGQSRFDTVLKMLLIAFVSLLAFSTGVFFGREMTEKDFKYKAAEAEFSHGKESTSEKQEDYALTKEDGEEAEHVSAEDVEALTENAVKNASSETAEHKTEAKAEGHGSKEAEHMASAEKAEAEHGKATEEVETLKTEKKTAGHHEEARTVASSHAETKPIVKTAKAVEEEMPVATAAHGKATAKSAKPDLKEVQEAARRVASNETPAAPAAAHAKASENRVPSSLPKSVGTAKETEYTVQVASYPSLDEAKSQANKLVEKGFPAYPVEAEIKGKKWFRVSVGSFKTQKEAGEYRSTLMKQAELKSAIVQKIQR